MFLIFKITNLSSYIELTLYYALTIHLYADGMDEGSPRCSDGLSGHVGCITLCCIHRCGIRFAQALRHSCAQVAYRTLVKTKENIIMNV